MPKLVHVGTLARVKGDTFAETRQIVVSGEIDAWTLADMTVSLMHDVLANQGGHLAKQTVMASDQAGGTFNRPSFREAGDALAEYDLFPYNASQHIALTPDLRRPGEGRVDVRALVMWRHGTVLNVRISSKNKLIVNGLAAELEKILKKVTERAAAMVVASGAFDRPPPSEPTAPNVSAGEPELPTDREGWRAWLKRNWREHRPTIIIGLSTTLVGGILLAWLLG